MIHYHGTPFSGGDAHIALQGKHAMVSFAAPSHVSIIAELCQSFCLDNGAFSVWKSGGTLDIEKYIKWADKWLRHPGCDFAVIPDVIDGTEEENDMLIARWHGDKYQYSPVWHLHESIDRLVRLCENWPRVCLGSSGEFSKIGTRQWWDRIAVAMDAIVDDDGHPITKLHGLRMLDPGLSSYIPFASADSTNVARNIGFDIRWPGPYEPNSLKMRAMVIMERIEAHACASHWHKGFRFKQDNFEYVIKTPNLDLLG